MFELIDGVTVKKTYGGCVEGVMTKETPWVDSMRRRGRTQVGGMAVRAESITDFMNFIDATKDETRNYRAHRTSDDNYGHGWQDFRSLKECFTTFRDEPWKVRTFDAYDVPLKFANNSGNWTEYDVTGDFIDIGAMLEGIPEHWGHNTMGNPDNLFCRIIMNLSASASYEGDALRRRGQRVTRLVDWLETQGIRTEVLALNASECAHVEVVVKRYDEPLNLDVIAVAGHSDFYRRLVFRVIEMSQTYHYGHGTATLISNGYLTLPPVTAQNILIWSENASYVEKIDKSFDKIEKDLEQALEDGDKHFRGIV